MLDLAFEVVSDSKTEVNYSDGCSNTGRSDCCTRVCTRDIKSQSAASLKAWDNYLQINAGVLQY